MLAGDLLPERAPLIDAHGVYDPHLALSGDDAIVLNEIPSDARTTIVITGANSGGKSTLLRAIGCAQLMAQAGMFAPARSWSARVATSIFSHFVREEDVDMVRGRFADELQRLAQRHAALQRPQPRGLDGRAVGHGVGEGHAELDQVGACRRQRLDHGERGRGIGIPGHHEGDESGAALGLHRSEATVDARGHGAGC